MARVTSSLFVAALCRRAQAAGAFATVAKRGAEEAGAIFITVRNRDGVLRLLGPAMQLNYTSETSGERQFETLMDGVADDVIEQRMTRERSFDPDLWQIDIEDAEGRDFL